MTCAQLQFAVASFVSDTQWLCDFTSDTATAIAAVDRIEQSLDSSQWNATSLFDSLFRYLPVPSPNAMAIDGEDEDDFNLRVILLYFRADSSPAFDKNVMGRFTKHPNCYIDVLYVHDKPDPATKARVQAVYDSLHELSEGIDDKCFMKETVMHRKIAGFFAQMLGNASQRKVNGNTDIEPAQAGFGEVDGGRASMDMALA
ncbi:hypothetical protein HDU83_001686 [Entophlyctis luteolus]|nr:hypothetical protein HDU82_008185 [Entophlyctis luteolus]KAJ3347924.1 hypothetical protein HDU83_001686 [Entophlyctis luteolus]KAJ3384894.1 hypothetical protein HDU84_002599 [Entophlyctis sp. JEL0112]